MRSFSKKEACIVAWQRFRERPFFLIGVFVLTTVISIVASYIAREVGSGAVSVILAVLDVVVQVLMSMGITLILLRVYDQTDTSYADLFEPMHLFWKYTLMSILVFAAVLVGLVLFIIPGIIVAIALLFAAYLVIDRQLGPIAAIQESLRITNGHRWNLFIFIIILIAFNTLGALFFGVGLLLTIPLSVLATVHVYRWLLNPPEEREEPVTLLAKVVSVLVALFTIALITVGVAWMSLTSIDSPEYRDQERRQHIADITRANMSYFEANGRFPETLGALVPEHLARVPTDPTTGEPYAYLPFAGGVDYEVCAVFESLDVAERVYCEYGLDVLRDGAAPQAPVELLLDDTVRDL